MVYLITEVVEILENLLRSKQLNKPVGTTTVSFLEIKRLQLTLISSEARVPRKRAIQLSAEITQPQCALKAEKLSEIFKCIM